MTTTPLRTILNMASAWLVIAQCPPCFLPNWFPATISKEDFHRHSDKASKALRYMTRSSGDDELDQGLWTKTLAEVDKGWMRGPLPWDDLPMGAAVSRRFPPLPVRESEAY